MKDVLKLITMSVSETPSARMNDDQCEGATIENIKFQPFVSWK